MTKLPALKPKQVVQALLRAGFYITHQKGSHVHLRHYQKTHLRVTVPYHSNFDLPPSIVNSILKQAELSKEEFIKLLKRGK
jgi:predicted RNA binding protein YcfA (HicA-like mRNA interferase family)